MQIRRIPSCSSSLASIVSRYVAQSAGSRQDGIMPDPSETLGIFLHLARASAQRRRPQVRDRLLVIAGAIASQLGLAKIAARCRDRILANNPHHMLRNWHSYSVALQDPDFLHLLKQLQRRYPLEKAERLLASLGIDLARERAAYYSDEEYAAALLHAIPASSDESA